MNQITFEINEQKWTPQGFHEIDQDGFGIVYTEQTIVTFDSEEIYNRVSSIINQAMEKALATGAPDEHSPIEELQETEQEKLNKNTLDYLHSTDWYVIRFIETGIEIPEAIKEARQAARERFVLGV